MDPTALVSVSLTANLAVILRNKGHITNDELTGLFAEAWKSIDRTVEDAIPGKEQAKALLLEIFRRLVDPDGSF